jgi:hypothetical protein
MKPTEFIVENSIIAQEADDMHRDHEVQMARSQMYSAAQAAIEIHRLLRDVSEMEGLEGWVQSKLTLASQYLESVRDYMKYEAVSQEPEMMAFAESAAEYALESLIAEEGETGVERDASARRENERYDNARNYQGRNARGDVIRSGGEVVKGNPNPPSLIQRAAGALGLPNTATDALGDPMYKSSRSKAGGSGTAPISTKTAGIRGGGGGGSIGDIGYTRSMDLGAEFDPKTLMKRNAMKEQTPAPAPGTSTPVVGGMAKSTDAAGRTTTSYNMGPVSVSKSTGGGIPDVSSASTQVMDKTVTQHTGVGFGGAGAGVQQGGNKITTVTEKNKKLKEMATGGASSAGSVATSMGGPRHKPTSGVPKKVGNSYKPKQVTVGKGVYDK